MKEKPNVDYREKLKNGMTLHIRPATGEDAEKIIEYLNKVGGESDYLTFGENEFSLTVEEETNFLNQIQESASGLILLGFVDGNLASVGSLSPNTKKRLSHNSCLGISVLKKFWRLGIGKKMMGAMIGFAESCDQTEIIQLDVMSTNKNAIALYEKMGFVQVGYRKNNLKKGNGYQDAVLMDKYL